VNGRGGHGGSRIVLRGDCVVVRVVSGVHASVIARLWRLSVDRRCSYLRLFHQEPSIIVLAGRKNADGQTIFS
jgi:hypothetical protein